MYYKTSSQSIIKQTKARLMGFSWLFSSKKKMMEKVTPKRTSCILPRKMSGIIKRKRASCPSLRFTKGLGKKQEPELDVVEDSLADPTIMSTLIRQRKWDTLITLIASEPELLNKAFLVEENGTQSIRLALHEICRHKAPYDVFQVVKNGDPRALRFKDSKYGFLPIHFACRHGASRDIVEELVLAFPESIHVTDKYGSTPINLVKNNSYDNKNSVLEAFEKMKNENDSKVS
mmetsp:Transcript_25340/g.30682  ORF Transcript_25340/g.30682 Transcript_25340/m.30682 type:complete len:232 (-) Transcript_25340:119-814(-)